MLIKIISPKFLSLYILFVIAVLLKPSAADAASLDDIYTPLLLKGKYLYQLEISQYGMTEEGTHGSTSFSEFSSDPGLVAAEHFLRFLPVSNLEIQFGYGHHFPSTYTRLTNDDPTGVLDTVQDYWLDYVQDYFFDARFRRKWGEIYIKFQEKRQKSKADTVLLLDNTASFDTITAHYEDLKLGIRYLSEADQANPGKGYLDLTHPLLSGRQINVEMNTGFKNGKIKNMSDINFAGDLFLRNYIHELRPHFIPELLFKYGISDHLEVGGGIAYTSPFKYNYEYKQFNPDGVTNFITGTYSIENDLKVPLHMTYRPGENMFIKISSDFHYTKQRFDSREKEDTTFTLYTTRKLRAYNTKPTFEFSYLLGEENAAEKNPFISLTKPLLGHKQLLLHLKYQKDITNLLKSDGNNAQNVIDPYNIFLYPLDLFVSGTEYGTFFLGNKTTRAAEVQPQNYHQIEAGIKYGVRSYLNVGLDVGFRSRNTLHHFTVQDLADRYYIFEPYNYFNFLADLKLKENNLFSLKFRYVPKYKTFLDTSAHTKQFVAATRYFEASLTFKVLF